MNVAFRLVLAAAVVTSPLVDLRLVHGSLDVPVADVLALAVAVAWGLYSASRGAARDLLPPALPWWGLFLGVCALSALATDDPARSLYYVLRNAVFPWVVYGGAAAGAVRVLVAGDRIARDAAGYVLALALLLAPPSLWLLQHGATSGYFALDGLVNNHKVLAVAIAPWLGALLRWRPLVDRAWRAPWDVAFATAAFAVAVSFSKTAWLAAGLGLVAFVPLAGRPLVARPVAFGAIGVGGGAAMMALPFVTRIWHMEDAFDSRMSLNLRAWRMWSDAPWLGQGPGMHVRWLMNEAPHWRIDHVDAHGIVQKMAGEVGAVGLVAYLAAWAWFTSRFFEAARSDDRVAQGAGALGLVLQVELLLTTDCFASTYWMPLAVALAFARGRDMGRGLRV